MVVKVTTLYHTSTRPLDDPVPMPYLFHVLIVNDDDEKSRIITRRDEGGTKNKTVMIITRDKIT